VKSEKPGIDDWEIDHWEIGLGIDNWRLTIDQAALRADSRQIQTPVRNRAGGWISGYSPAITLGGRMFPPNVVTALI
jgi:hypothetical protein